MMSNLTLEQQVAELTKNGASSKEAMDTLVKSFGAIKERLEKPVYPGVHYNPEGGAMSYFEEDDSGLGDTTLRVTDTEGYDGAQKRKSYRGIRKSVNREL